MLFCNPKQLEYPEREPYRQYRGRQWAEKAEFRAFRQYSDTKMSEINLMVKKILKDIQP